MQTIYFRSIRQTNLERIEKAKKGAWLHVTAPSRHDLLRLDEEYGFDPDLLSDGVDLYESPRIEHEDGITYIFVRYCSVDNVETSTEPLLIVVTNEHLLTVARRSPRPIEVLLESKVDELITTQKIKLILQMLAQVNAGYRQHLNKVTKQVFASRKKLQGTSVSNEEVLKFIDIEEDLNEFLAALQPYGIVLQALISGRYLTMHEEDEDLIEDLVLSTNELIELTKSRLKTIHNIREAYSTIAANNLNLIFKRLTSIAIFMSVPTIVGGLYGMNVALPFDDHPQAFWIVLAMVGLCVSAFIWIFNRRKWL